MGEGARLRVVREREQGSEWWSPEEFFDTPLEAAEWAAEHVREQLANALKGLL